MSAVSITVDGRVEFDGELSEWVQTPPDFIKDRIRPDFRPEPWAQAILVAITDALMRNRPISVEVRTSDNGEKWTMEVGP